MLNWLNDLSRRQDTRPTRKAAAARLDLESLSERTLPSGVSLYGGELHIEGTAGHDVATVTRVNNQVRVNFDGQVSVYNAARVRHVSFSGRDGNDRFTNQTSIASDAHGGRGNDLLIGGSSRDRLFGDAGRDMLLGRAGNDHLDGGLDRDHIDGGSGFDDEVGEAGDDNHGVESILLSDQGSSTSTTDTKDAVFASLTTR